MSDDEAILEIITIVGTVILLFVGMVSILIYQLKKKDALIAKLKAKDEQLEKIAVLCQKKDDRIKELLNKKTKIF